MNDLPELVSETILIDDDVTFVVKADTSEVAETVLRKNMYQDFELTNCEQATILGWNVNNGLSWRSHMQYLVDKLSSLCYALRLISRNVGAGAAIIAYHTFVNYRLMYVFLRKLSGPKTHIFGTEILYSIRFRYKI